MIIRVTDKLILIDLEDLPLSHYLKIEKFYVNIRFFLSKRHSVYGNYFILLLGGHINPAVSFAMTLLGRLPWRQLPFYWVGQTIGAFLASSVAYGMYYGNILTFYVFIFALVYCLKKMFCKGE